MFENAVSLQIILNDSSSKLAKTFIKTNARRNKEIIGNLDIITPALSDELKIPMQQALHEDIKEDGLDIKTLKGEVKGSWCPGRSYEEMARDVGAESLYQAQYQVGSNTIHPSWDNLKRYHLERDKDGKWEPAISFRDTEDRDISSALCYSLHALGAYMSCITPVTIPEVERIQGIHRTLHRLYAPQFQVDKS